MEGSQFGNQVNTPERKTLFQREELSEKYSKIWARKPQVLQMQPLLIAILIV